MTDIKQKHDGLISLMIDIKQKHDGLISLMIELLAEAEIDEVNAVVPVDMYHLLSERCLDYVRLIEFTTETH